MLGVPLDHIAIHVADRAAAERVVRELLGHQAVQELAVHGPDGTAHLGVMAQPGDRFRLVLCDADEATHPIARWVASRGPGVHHMAHRVDQVETALQQIADTGAVVGAIVEAPGLRQVFVEVADDGMLHEITQRTGETGFVEENTAALIEAGADRHNGPPPSAPWRPDRR